MKRWATKCHALVASAAKRPGCRSTGLACPAFAARLHLLHRDSSCNHSVSDSGGGGGALRADGAISNRVSAIFQTSSLTESSLGWRVNHFRPFGSSRNSPERGVSEDEKD